MTSRIDLEALAARVEAAEAADRELDAAIFLATQRPYSACHRTIRCNPCKCGCRRKSLRKVEPTTNGGRPVFWIWFRDGSSGGTDDIPYTASIDAALQLVPEGWAIEGWLLWPGEPSSLRLLEARLKDDGRWWRDSGCLAVCSSNAATPALALCAAALRARAS